MSLSCFDHSLSAADQSAAAELQPEGQEGGVRLAHSEGNHGAGELLHPGRPQHPDYGAHSAPPGRLQAEVFGRSAGAEGQTQGRPQRPAAPHHQGDDL